MPIELRSVATCTALRTISPSCQRFSLLMGRHSMMRTTSPTLAWSLFVVRVKLLALADDSLIQRMRHAPRHFDHDGLGHLVRDHAPIFSFLMLFSVSAVGTYPLLAFFAPSSPPLSAARRLLDRGHLHRSLRRHFLGLHRLRPRERCRFPIRARAESSACARDPSANSAAS